MNSKLNSEHTKPNLDIAQIVHDLKNPLTSIIGSIDFLKNNKVTEKTKEQLYDVIESESKNILSFVNDILEVSKIENDLDIKSDTKSNIAAIIGKTLKDLKSQIKEKNIKIKTDISENLEIKIPEIRIKQILSNLISNAVKYNKKFGKLIINAYKKIDGIYIEIEDTGIGMPENEIQKIFDKFYRCKEIKKLQIYGTGLGLSIVKSIVDAYGGRIRVSSQINKGSKFCVFLPFIGE